MKILKEVKKFSRKFAVVTTEGKSIERINGRFENIILIQLHDEDMYFKRRDQMGCILMLKNRLESKDIVKSSYYIDNYIKVINKIEDIKSRDAYDEFRANFEELKKIHIL